MNAEILAVGTELLLGGIVNTNAQYLCERLAGLGIPVYYQTAVGDNAGRIKNALKSAFERADIVITSGGLGPTEDDLTKETAAAFFGRELVMDGEALRNTRRVFEKQNSEMPESNRKQALIPEGARAVPNGNGTAPGIIMEEGEKTLILLPGPPSELKPMFEEHIEGYLRKRSGNPNQSFFSRSVHITGIGESMAEAMMKDLIEAQGGSRSLTIAPYAKESEMYFRLTAAAATREEADRIMRPVADEMRRRFGDNIYAEDGRSLAEVVIQMIRDRRMTLACAESCTGGLLASAFVDVPGASDVFLEGVIAYGKNAKISRLGVSARTLGQFGEVSEQTAQEMATGIRRTAGADIGLATTGIAGPGGGSAEKPVGLVYIAACVNGDVSVRELNLSGNRNKVRAKTVTLLIDMLRRTLLAGAPAGPLT